jgi:hypothetical protein
MSMHAVPCRPGHAWSNMGRNWLGPSSDHSNELSYELTSTWSQHSKIHVLDSICVDHLKFVCSSFPVDASVSNVRQCQLTHMFIDFHTYKQSRPNKYSMSLYSTNMCDATTQLWLVRLHVNPLRESKSKKMVFLKKFQKILTPPWIPTRGSSLVNSYLLSQTTLR